MLTEDMRRQGDWLFRWRSYLPLALLVLVVITLPAAGDLDGKRWDHVWEVGCIAVSLFGLAIRALSIGYVPRGTSGRNTRGQVAEALNTRGMYSVVRHPLYLGNFFMWLGVALYPRLWWVAVIVVLVFWLYYERIVVAEEAFLRQKYGGAYVQWAETTPAFVPRLGGWHSPALPFSLRSVLRREYSGLFGLIATFTALEVASDRLSGRVEIDRGWLALFTAGSIVYLVLRTLKRKTRVLHVEGR